MEVIKAFLQGNVDTFTFIKVLIIPAVLIVIVAVVAIMCSVSMLVAEYKKAKRRYELAQWYKEYNKKYKRY